MKRSIVDILIFQSPFESEKIFEEKYKKLKEMFDDYITNSGIPLKKSLKWTDVYTQEKFLYESSIEITFYKKNITQKNNYLPAIIINYKLDDSSFSKENILDFLNDNIKFTYNVYFENFFIDYDKNFKLNDINTWKKLDFNHLKIFDTVDKNSLENKMLLDSMMYIYYSLVKNIFDIHANSDNIDTIIMQSNDINLVWQLELCYQRQDNIKKKLIENALKIKTQIDNFIILLW